jgi:3-hydroxy-9,10-secoandrosta-1,3,5(10)-triene-9,17-dione monooxygenase reductase component
MSGPFADPPESRDPARRLRGRLAAPVTVWTAGRGAAATGLTVSSVLIAEGEPARILGLVGDLSDLWEAVQDTRTFVVHVLTRADHALADRFSGRTPVPGGALAGVPTADSPHGPLLSDVPTRVACRLEDAPYAGFTLLVRGTVEAIDLPDAGADGDDPLIWFRGRYRRLAERRTLS